MFPLLPKSILLFILFGSRASFPRVSAEEPDSEPIRCLHCLPDEDRRSGSCVALPTPQLSDSLCPLHTTGCILMSVTQDLNAPPYVYGSCYSTLELECMKRSLNADLEEAKCGKFDVTFKQYENYIQCVMKNLTGMNSEEDHLTQITPSVQEKIDFEEMKQKRINLQRNLDIQVRYCLCPSSFCNRMRYFEKAGFQVIKAGFGSAARSECSRLKLNWPNVVMIVVISILVCMIFLKLIN